MKERLYERILPKITQHELDQLLSDAHMVDGIVKGLKQRDWPQNNWQALHRLAIALCQLCK
jgi:DNA polymerase-3 subunit delta